MSDGWYDGRMPRRRPLAAPTETFPTFDEIARRAHELFLADGRCIERIFECWHRAEDELLDRAARRAIR